MDRGAWWATIHVVAKLLHGKAPQLTKHTLWQIWLLGLHFYLNLKSSGGWGVGESLLMPSVFFRFSNVFRVFYVKVKVKVTQSCPTLCDPMDYIVHGIFQARILEWVVFSLLRGSSQPRDLTQVSHIAGRFFYSWGTREAKEYWSGLPIPSPEDLPHPGIEPGSPALQVDSLPTELSGKPVFFFFFLTWDFWNNVKTLNIRGTCKRYILLIAFYTHGGERYD